MSNGPNILHFTVSLAPVAREAYVNDVASLGLRLEKELIQLVQRCGVDLRPDDAFGEDAGEAERFLDTAPLSPTEKGDAYREFLPSRPDDSLSSSAEAALALWRNWEKKLLGPVFANHDDLQVTQRIVKENRQTLDMAVSRWLTTPEFVFMVTWTNDDPESPSLLADSLWDAAKALGYYMDSPTEKQEDALTARYITCACRLVQLLLIAGCPLSRAVTLVLEGSDSIWQGQYCES